MAEGGIAKLNLGGLAQGEVQVSDGGEIMATPRAASEEVIPTTPRGGQKELKKGFVVTSEQLGVGKALTAWQPNGKLLATVGANCILELRDASGIPLQSVKLESNKTSGPVTWLAWDCSGQWVAALSPGIALYIWPYNQANQLVLIDQTEQTSQFTSLKWSSNVTQLALGTNIGRVMMFNPAGGKVQCQKSGKHPGSGKQTALMCMDWMADNRLCVGSGSRVKISHPIQEDCEWKTYSKMHTAKMQEKVPKKMVSIDGPYNCNPTLIKFSHEEQSMLAMNLGVKVMVIIVWQQTVQEEGFFIPLEYGEITDFVWLPLNTLMISLSNGYVLVVDADLLMDKARKAQAKPGTTMKTARVFEMYMTKVALSPEGGRVAIVGDTSIKIVEVNKTDEFSIVVTHELALERNFDLGDHLSGVEWSSEGISASTTDGHVYHYAFD